MRRNDKKAGSKGILLGILFIVTMVVTFLSMGLETVIPSATTMTEATLPVVAMLTGDGTEFNSLHGYTVAINQALMNDTLTPVPQNRKQDIVIHTYGAEVSEVSYKVRSLSDSSLIENTKVNELERDTDKITATLAIKNLIDDNVQYALEIVLKTPAHDEIHYYTRIVTGDDYGLESKFEFVKYFNACTMDQSRLSEIQKYIESSTSGSNSNYGKVNINSSLSQVGWGDIAPYAESQLIPKVKEISSDIAIITLNYRAGAVNEYDSYDSYNVYEYYRIRQTSSGFYLLNYEREANQIFDGKNDLTSSGKINLGIQSASTTEFSSDENSKYAYYVNEGSLWCFNTEDSVYTMVFSFNSDETDGIRENYGEHGIKILNVQDNGDSNFLVYGYMNRGEHEGESGVSLCRYSYADNKVEERLYIPVDIPYDILSQNIGNVAYLSDENTFYILMDDTLYSVDLVSKEVMTVVSDLVDGTYAVSEDGSAIAYSLNGKPYATESIRVFNMADSSEHIIQADSGDYIKCLGYINSDFIYGVADKDDILINEDGNRTFAMHKICIMDTAYNVIKEYEEPGIYVSDASVEDMRINLTRIVKSGDGYQGTSIDQLINKDENVETDGIMLDSVVSDNRKQELALKLSKVPASFNVSLRTSSDVVYMEDALLELAKNFTGEGRYYVYGYGRFQSSTTDISKALSLAYDTYGSVADYNANTIWKRYRNTTGELKGISLAAAAADSSLGRALQLVAAYAGAQTDAAAYLDTMTADEILSGIQGVSGLSIKGVSIDKILNFIDNGCPVIGKNGSDSYVIITAYDSKNVTYMDPVSGAEQTVSLSDANKMFTQWENVFVTYYKN